MEAELQRGWSCGGALRKRRRRSCLPLPAQPKGRSAVGSTFQEEAALLFADGEAEVLHDAEHVFPDLAFLGEGGVGVEEIGRVVGDAEGDALEFAPGATESADGFDGIEESFGGGGAEGDDALGFDDPQFGPEEGEAGAHFLAAGLAVVGGLVLQRGAELADIGDVDLLAAESHGSEDGVELLTGLADEGFAAAFFLVAGGFADEDDLCFGVSDREDHRLAEGAEIFGGFPCLGLFAEGGELLGAGAVGDGEGGDRRGSSCRDGGTDALLGFGGRTALEESAKDGAGFLIEGDVGDSLPLHLAEVVDEDFGLGHGGSGTREREGGKLVLESRRGRPGHDRAVHLRKSGQFPWIGFRI